MSMHANFVALSAGCITDDGLLILLLALGELLGLGMQVEGALPLGEVRWQTILLVRGSGHLQACVHSPCSAHQTYQGPKTIILYCMRTAVMPCMQTCMAL